MKETDPAAQPDTTQPETRTFWGGGNPHEHRNSKHIYPTPEAAAAIGPVTEYVGVLILRKVAPLPDGTLDEMRFYAIKDIDLTVIDMPVAPEELQEAGRTAAPTANILSTPPDAERTVICLPTAVLRSAQTVIDAAPAAPAQPAGTPRPAAV